MKRLLFAVSFAAFSVFSMAQAATRTVVLSWTASTSTSVTGYSVYSCTVPAGGTSCTPSITGTGTSVTGTTYTVQEATGQAYGFSVIAVAPPCSNVTPTSTPCGNSVPATVTFVPVPPQTSGASNVVVVVP
jgi:hypothetical protein